jgi:hypothetical protein
MCEKQISGIKSRVHSAIPLDPLMRIVLSISALVAKSTETLQCFVKLKITFSSLLL